MSFKRSLLVFVLIFALGGFLRLYKLDSQSFIADEYLGIKASYGYFKTGQWKFWDFNKNQIGDESYTRGKVYYWQVSQVFRFLSPDEDGSRIVSVAWGMLGLLAVFLAAYYFTRNASIALIAALLLAVSISALIYDRKLRMYSMFSPVYFLMSMTLFQFIESKYKGSVSFIKRINEKTGLNWIYLVPLVLLAAISFFTHFLTVNIIPVALVFFLTMGVKEYINGKTLKENKYFWFVVLFIFVLIPFSATKTYAEAMNFFALLQHWSYLEKVTLDYSYILFAGVFLVAGSYFLIRRYERLGIWLVVSFFVPLLLAMFTWRRVVGDQYIYFTEIFKVIIYAAGVYFVAEILSECSKLSMSKGKATALFSSLLVLLSINIPFFFSGEGFYQGIKSWSYPNYREAFSHYRKNKQPGDVIITRNLVNYYLKDTKSDTISYSDEDKLTLEKITQAQERYGRVWIIYTKDNNIDGEAERYIQENFKLIETSYTNKNVNIWLWDPKNTAE